MTWLRNTVEAASFKPVPGGYVFRAPSAALFGSAEHYFVTDAQKSEILPITLTTPRWVLGLSLIWLLMCGAAAALVAWGFTGSAFDAAITVVKVLAPATWIPIPFIAVRRTLRRLRPLLTGLPRADAQGCRMQE